MKDGINDSRTIVHDPKPLHEEGDGGTPPQLIIYYGYEKERGKKFSLQKSLITVGRSARNDIELNEESVSRFHAKIVHRNGACTVVDLDSTNGTFLNEERLQPNTPVNLEDSDYIHFGKVVMKYLAAGNVAAEFYDEAYKSTVTDSLTGIFNKNYLLIELEKELNKTSRYHRPLAFMMFDLDYFKDINDRYGHVAGDAVLRQFSERIQEIIRGSDIFARYGGEEFSLLCPETTRESALKLAEKLKTTIEQAHFHFNEETVEITISIGVVILSPTPDYPGREEDFHSQKVIQLADEKLYEAKTEGRNRIKL